MKRPFPSFLISTLLALSAARADEAVQWQVHLSAVSPRVGDTVELVISAEIPAHSYVYSSDFESDIGPQPTVLKFAESAGIELVGPVRSVEPKRKKDRTWDIELGYFETRAEFRQQVRILRPDFTVQGTIAGQLCNDQEGTCILFTQPLALTRAIVTAKK